MSGSLHPHAHTASCCLQLAIELLGFSIAVTQSPFTTFSGVGIYKRDLLNARVIVHTYNPHIGSFLPSLGSLTNQSLLGGRGGRHCYEIMLHCSGSPTRGLALTALEFVEVPATATVRTPLWLVCRWECRDRRPSKS